MNANEVVEQVKVLFKARGIETYGLFVRDPDNHALIYATHGDPIWMRGATDMIQEVVCDRTDEMSRE